MGADCQRWADDSRDLPEIEHLRDPAAHQRHRLGAELVEERVDRELRVEICRPGVVKLGELQAGSLRVGPAQHPRSLEVSPCPPEQTAQRLTPFEGLLELRWPHC
jgi:hypothetical protein